MSKREIENCITPLALHDRVVVKWSMLPEVELISSTGECVGRVGKTARVVYDDLPSSHPLPPENEAIVVYSIEIIKMTAAKLKPITESLYSAKKQTSHLC